MLLVQGVEIARQNLIGCQAQLCTAVFTEKFGFEFTVFVLLGEDLLPLYAKKS